MIVLRFYNILNLNNTIVFRQIISIHYTLCIFIDVKAHRCVKCDSHHFSGTTYEIVKRFKRQSILNNVTQN